MQPHHTKKISKLLLSAPQGSRWVTHSALDSYCHTEHHMPQRALLFYRLSRAIPSAALPRERCKAGILYSRSSSTSQLYFPRQHWQQCCVRANHTQEPSPAITGQLQQAGSSWKEDSGTRGNVRESWTFTTGIWRSQPGKGGMCSTSKTKEESNSPPSPSPPPPTHDCNLHSTPSSCFP